MLFVILQSGSVKGTPELITRGSYGTRTQLSGLKGPLYWTGLERPCLLLSSGRFPDTRGPYSGVSMESFSDHPTGSARMGKEHGPQVGGLALSFPGLVHAYEGSPDSSGSQSPFPVKSGIALWLENVNFLIFLQAVPLSGRKGVPEP